MRAMACAAALLLLGPLASSALAVQPEPGVAVSTAATTARVPRGNSPLSLTFIQTRQDRRLELGYSLRWDFSDIKEAGPGMLRTLRDPLGYWAGQSWDIRDHTRFVLYGVRVDPWKAFFGPSVSYSVAASSAAGRGAAGAAALLRRFHPSLMPVIKDINDHIEEDIRNEALRESLRESQRRLPADAPKRTVSDEQDLLRDLIRWQKDQGVPGLSGAADRLEFLAPQRAQGGAPRDDVHYSTGSAR